MYADKRQDRSGQHVGPTVQGAAYAAPSRGSDPRPTTIQYPPELRAPCPVPRSARPASTPTHTVPSFQAGLRSTQARAHTHTHTRTRHAHTSYAHATASAAISGYQFSRILTIRTWYAVRSTPVALITAHWRASTGNALIGKSGEARFGGIYPYHSSRLLARATPHNRDPMIP